MASPSDIQTRVDAAIVAIDAGSYDTALKEIEVAELIVASLPDAGERGASLNWSDRLAKIREHIQQRKAESKAASLGGIARRPFKLVELGSTE